MQMVDFVWLQALTGADPVDEGYAKKEGFHPLQRGDIRWPVPAAHQPRS